MENTVTQRISKIFNDFNLSSEYKMRKNFRSGLACGYNFPHYEEHRDACPFIFWENDKTKIRCLVNLLNNDELNSYFNRLGGYDINAI
jgi:hypothetical protein